MKRYLAHLGGRSLFTLATLLLTAVAAPPATAQALGVVHNVQTGSLHCGAGPKGLSSPYFCLQAVVSCGGIEDRAVTLRMTEPPSELPTRGTVIAGMGGGGTGWYEATDSARTMLDELNAAGFRVIQRAWGGEPDGEGRGGWINGSVGLVRSACRYATLLDFIYTHPVLHNPANQAFCATGNSGGSSEIGYALSHYGMGRLLDLALMTGGPPHGSLLRGCADETANWSFRCNNVLNEMGVCPQAAPASHACRYSPASVENGVDPAWELTGRTPCADQDFEALRPNSILGPGARVDYPQTAAWFLYGENDCGSAPAISVPYLLSVLRRSHGPAGFRVIQGAGHSVPASPAGAAAVRNALLGSPGCALRH